MVKKKESEYQNRLFKNFRSPEWKAKLVFLIKICLSIDVTVGVVMDETFRIFDYSRTNNLTNFNHKWHKAFLSKENSSIHQYRAMRLQGLVKT